MPTKYPGNIISLGGPESYSNSFNGSSSYLGLPSSSALSLSGDFTIEFWVYANSSSSNSQTIWCPSAIDRAIQVNGTSSSWIYWDGSAERSFGTFTAGVWSYITLTRSGTTVKGFLNGLQGFSITDSGTLEFSSGAIGYRQRTSAGAYFNGSLSNFRITKGAALYTANFVPPTGIASNSVPSGSVSLLTCQSSTIVDNSSNAFTITNTGGVSVSSYTPLQAYNVNNLNPALGSATPGVWSISQAMQAVQTRSWPMYDPYYNNVVLNLHGNGTNGAQNNTFLDSSSNNFTITRNGDTTQGSFNPYRQNGYWANYFNGSSDYLAIPDNAAMEWGSSSLTLEMWVFTGATTQYTTIMAREPLAFQTGEWALQVNQSGASSGNVGLFVWDYNSSSPLLSSTGVNVCNNAWHHIAVVRNVNAWTLYVDGVSVATNTWSGTVADLAYGTVIGRSDNYGRYFPGYISNVRFVKGTAVYTSNFTPSTTPLTAITNTSLLTCQSNRFVDNSSNAFAITVNGTPSVQAFQPFLQNLPYESSRLGGSGSFDGSGDYLTAGNNAAYNFGTGDFTIEFWAYITKSMTTSTITTALGYGGTLGSNGWAIDSGNSPNGSFALQYLTSPYPFVGTGVLPQNAWTHIAFVRSGTTISAYTNGVLANSITNSSSWSPTDGSLLTIGQHSNVIAGRDYQGYLTDVRLLKGVAAYTGAFTPPTKPIATSGAASAASYPSTTNVNTSFVSSACSLLTSMTNGAVFDNAAMNDLQTVGNAQISTTQSKYGGASMYFDGSGSYLYSVGKPVFDFYYGDFTIECWVRLSSVSTAQIFATCVPTGGLGFSSWSFQLTSSGFLQFDSFYGGTEQYITATNNALTTNTWTHIAYSRKSLTSYFFVNGNLCTTSGGPVSQQVISGGYPLTVGAGRYSGAINPVTGYIDDLRITKGVARYTGNFQPPTSQLQDQ